MYIFNSVSADGQSLVHVINLLLGENVTGAELGVYRATTTCTLAQNCPNIKKLYAIDNWKPYYDFIKEPYTGDPWTFLDEKEIEHLKLTAYHNIKFSGVQDKIHVLEMDSDEAAKQIADEELDFIFLDAHLTLKQLEEDLHIWYDKVKPGGIVAIHDTSVMKVEEIVIKFLQDKKITKSSHFADTIICIK